MIESRRLLLVAAFLALAGFAAFEPAWAAPIPGPLIGAGLPALALFAGGYWLIRRVRRDGNRNWDPNPKEREDEQA